MRGAIAPRMSFSLKNVLSIFGPGLVTGASDDDPSGVATYAQAGTQFGYAPLWLALFTLPFLIVIQEMCARIAIVTRQGLIQNLRKSIPWPILWLCVGLLVLANGMNAGADLGMMAASAHLVLPAISRMSWLLVFIALTLGLQIFLSYQTYAKYLKWLTLTLFCYILVAFVVHVNWSAALHATLFPQTWRNKEFFLLLIAFLGTTISPYLYFWQANQETEESKIVLKQTLPLPVRLSRATWDVISGMGLSNVVAWFIILTGATVLHAQGITSIDTADQAARLLEPLAGHCAALIFSIGILTTGLLAVPVLTSVVAYAVCEALGRTGGLSKTWREAKLFYGVIVILTVLSGLVNVSGVSPVRLLILSAVGNALIAPPLLAAIIWLGNAPAMRQHKNGPWSNAIGALTVAIMTIASIAGMYLLLT